MKEARWWSNDNGRIKCYLCPRYCKVADGQTGFCFVRKNEHGVLQSLVYGYPCAINVDPIEKKPLFHFYPATNILSIGTLGCNLGCQFCQNWDITKTRDLGRLSTELEPEDIVSASVKYKCPSIAFTYNEPTIWAEYAVDISKLAHQKNIKTVMVTNGYITKEAFYDVYNNIDGANVDLKSFNEHFYGKYTHSHIDPVLKALKLLKKDTTVWIEITTLLIPGLNDSDEEIKKLSSWIYNELGPDVPLHFSAFHPTYKLLDRPPTSPHALENARRIAMNTGINYVYVGNISSDSANTYCPKCKQVLIKRNWHSVSEMNCSNGKCPCGQVIPGRFE